MPQKRQRRAPRVNTTPVTDQAGKTEAKTLQDLVNPEPTAEVDARSESGSSDTSSYVPSELSSADGLGGDILSSAEGSEDGISDPELEGDEYEEAARAEDSNGADDPNREFNQALLTQAITSLPNNIATALVSQLIPALGGGAAAAGASPYWQPTPDRRTFAGKRHVVMHAIKVYVLAHLDETVAGLSLDDILPGVIAALPLPDNTGSKVLLKTQFKQNLRATLREAESELNTDLRNQLLLIYSGIIHRVMVHASNATLHAAAKAEHVALFAGLVAAPPGFKLEGEDEFMFAFHAAVDPQNHTLLAFAHKEWPALIQQYLTFLPSGRSRTITLKFVAYTVMSLWQTLTFVPDTEGVLQYGKRNRETGSSARFERIKAWLLDADACPTKWEPLLRIREAAA